MSAALVKYVGSKRWLVEQHAARLPVAPVALVPFVGGGSIPAYYASLGCRVIASDLNARVINAHQAVQASVEDVIGRLRGIVNAWQAALARVPEPERDAAGRVFYERVRDRVDDGDASERAATLLFVIRAGFNGLLRENASRAITTAYGKPRSTRDLVAADELRSYARAVQGVEFLHEDFAVTCGRARSSWCSYLDSPYQGTFTGYCGGDWEAAQETLPGLAPVNDRRRLVAMLDYLAAIGVRWALSDSDTPTTRSLYGRWAIDTLSRRGTVNSDGDGRADVTELFVTNTGRTS